jgi:U3 small nucleolar RNA-associated protein 12
LYISALEDGFEVQDFIVSHVQVSSKHRVHSFCFQRSTASSETVVTTKKQRKPKKNELVIALKDNQLEQYKYKKEQTRPLAKFDRAGHRSDIRALTLSFDDSLVATTSSNLLKIYHMKKHEFVRTLECGYGLCCQFLPGNNNIILVGTKTGNIEIHDLSAASLIESVKAHDGSVWSMGLTPDGRGLVSGGADKTVKIWKFVLQSIEPESENGEPEEEEKDTMMKDKMVLKPPHIPLH